MMNTFISSSAMMVRSNRHKIVSANEIPNEAPPLRTISPDLALDIIQKNINSLFEAVQSSTEKRSIDAIKTAAQALERQLNQILDTNPGLLHPDDLQLLQDIMEIIKKNPMTSDQNKNFQNFDMISTLFEKRATEISFSQEQIKTNRYAQFLALSATVLSKIQILSLGSLAGSSLWDTWSAIGYAELFTELSPMRWDGQNYNYNAYVMNPDFGKGNPLPELKENSKPACMTGVTGVDKGPNELNATYSVVGGDRPAHKWHTRLQTLFPWTKLASNSDSSNGHQARTWDLVLQEQHIQAKRDYIIETILKSSDGKGQFKYGLNERSAREMALALAKGDFTFVPMSTIINSLQETGVGTRKSQFLWKILGEKGGERVVLWSLESVLKNALDEGRFDKTLFNRLRENLASLRSSSDMSSAMDSTQYEKLLNDFLSRNAVSDEETRNSIINNFYTGNSNDKTKYTADKSNLKLMDRWYNFIRDQAIDNGYDSDGNNRSNAAAKMIIDEARRLSLLQKIADSPTKDDLSRAYSISESMAEEILAAIPNNIDQIGSDVAGHYSTVTRDINGNANHEDVLTQFHLRLAGMMTIVYEIKDGRDQREANYLRVMKKIVNNTKSPLIPFFKNAGLSTLKQNADGIYKCNGNMEESFRVLLESRFMKTHLGFSTPQAEFIVSAIIDQIADCQVEFLEDWVNKVEHELNAHPEFSLNQAIEAHQNNLQALVGIKIDEILRKGGPVHSALAKKFKYNNFDDPITYQLVVDGTKDIANSLLAEDMFENVNAHANGLGQEVMQNARWAKETLGLMENNPKIYSFQTAFATLRTQRETTTNLSETTFGEDGKSFIKLLDKLS